MELIINHDLATAQSEFHRPRIFTLDLVARLAAVNSAARRLRALGFRVIDEDASPDDAGKPILQIDLNGLDQARLLNLCDASTYVAGCRITGVVLDVRVLVDLRGEPHA